MDEQSTAAPSQKGNAQPGASRRKLAGLSGPELYEVCKTDERAFIELCLSVKDRETNEMVPFRFNHTQEMYERSKSKFDIILKARKLGFSTRVIARDLWACAFQKNQHRILLCQTDDDTKKQLEERVKPILQSSILPLGAIERDKYILFPQTKSRYYIGTAGSKKFGRGSDVTGYHLSEYAFWEDTTVLTGLEQACLPGAEGTIESTANGQNVFYSDWKRAKLGLGRYKPFFVPWWSDPAYSIAGGRLDGLTQDEQELRDAFDLTSEQLAWRRKTIKEMSRPELFPQEFPARPDEAFLASGRMVFDWVSLVRHEKRCAEPMWRGFLRDMGESIDLIPLKDGNLSVWDNPEARHVYAIGADASEGLEDGDYSSAFVLDVGSGRQVAEWHGHIDPRDFAEVLYLLGLFYNTALVIPESWPTAHGAVMTQRLVDLGYRNIYEMPGKKTDNTSAKRPRYGWHTNQTTRQVMLHSLAGDAVREFNLVIQSAQLVDEMRSFIFDEAGRMDHSSGTHDDRVIAAALAWYTTRQIADGLHYAKPKLRELEFKATHSAGVSQPQWKGPRYGVRPS